jgi:hypothetical protein
MKKTRLEAFSDGPCHHHHDHGAGIEEKAQRNASSSIALPDRPWQIDAEVSVLKKEIDHETKNRKANPDAPR